MLEAELDGRLEVAELGAAIVARAFERVGIHSLVAKQRGDAIGELDLAARPASRALELLVDRRRQDLASDDRER